MRQMSALIPFSAAQLLRHVNRHFRDQFFAVLKPITGPIAELTVQHAAITLSRSVILHISERPIRDWTMSRARSRRSKGSETCSTQLIA